MAKAKKEEKVEKDNTFIGLELGAAKVIDAVEVELNGKELYKLTLSDGTTQLLSIEVIKELTK
jgi:hypothetical protein